VRRGGGDEGRGHRGGAPRHLAGQRELPALRPEPQAGQPARRPALRGDDGRPEAPPREPPGHEAGDRPLSAPEDLLERIRLRLEESFVGIGEVVAELPGADVADLVNQLTLQEAATVMTMLAVPRAIEAFAQPTLDRRSAILEQLDPGRAGQIVEGLSADERTAVVRA